MPDFTAAETEAAMALIRTCMDQRTNYEGRKPLPTEVLLAEIDRLRAARDELVPVLKKLSDLFSDIRGDWSDPRHECREGQDLIAALIAKHGADHG